MNVSSFVRESNQRDMWCHVPLTHELLFFFSREQVNLLVPEPSKTHRVMIPSNACQVFRFELVA